MTASASFEALGTTATLVVTDRAALGVGRRLLVAELDRIDRACSRFRVDSELSLANADPGRPRRVSALFAAALRAALDAAEATGGIVVPTLGAPLAAAGYDRTFRLVREREPLALLAAPAASASCRTIRLDDERREVTVPPGVLLDLGATAKAFAADRAAAAVTAATGAGALVSLGGDIAVAGDAPPPCGWAVLVAEDHAAPPTSPGSVVSISSGGLATSSTRVRRWRTNRGELHHIFDPRTGRPAVTPWRTVSVAARTCLDANIAATCAVVLGSEATGWLLARGLPARLVATDGPVSIVGGWPADSEAA